MGDLQDLPQDRCHPDHPAAGLQAAARQLGHASDTITETYYIPRSETGPQVAALLDEVLRSSDPTA